VTTDNNSKGQKKENSFPRQKGAKKNRKEKRRNTRVFIDLTTPRIELNENYTDLVLFLSHGIQLCKYAFPPYTVLQ